MIQVRDDRHRLENIRNHIDNLQAHHINAKRGTLDDFDVPIWRPDTVNDQIKVFGVDSKIYPNGITIVKLSITLDADTAYSMVFERWKGDPPAHVADIETVSTTGTDAYAQVEDDNIDNPSLDADDYIYLDIPATDVDWIQCKVIYIID